MWRVDGKVGCIVSFRRWGEFEVGLVRRGCVLGGLIG